MPACGAFGAAAALLTVFCLYGAVTRRVVARRREANPGRPTRVSGRVASLPKVSYRELDDSAFELKPQRSRAPRPPAGMASALPFVPL